MSFGASSKSRRKIIWKLLEKTGNWASFQIFMRVTNIQNKLKRLINNEVLFFSKFPLTTNLYKKIINFSRDQQKCFIHEEGLSGLFFEILFNSGYLTMTKDGKFKIPNQEIKEEFISRISEFFVLKFDLNLKKVTECEAEMTFFSKRFDDVLKQCPDFLETQSKSYEIHPNEEIIHSVLYIIASHIAKNIQKDTEIYCYNQKKCDIFMTSKSRKLTVIIEVKFNTTTAEALDQIIDQKYIQGLPNSDDIQNQILIGVNVTKNKKTEFALIIK